MKKVLLATIAVVLTGQLFAGGIVTNTNQSAMYTRLLARDATLGLDAVYFNPAGVSLFANDGFFLSLSNQSIVQTRTITSDYRFLNESEYIGNVSAPLFPSVYAGYKMGNLAISAGFNPIGGGGGAKYKKGLPTLEYTPSDLVPALSGLGLPVTDYSVNASFEGTSVFFGYQVNVSYKINDLLSVALGGRLVTAKETYNGYMRDIRLTVNGYTSRADDYFNVLGDQATAGAAAAAGAVTSMQPIIDLGAGVYTLAQLEGLGYIDAATVAMLEGGLVQLGVDPAGLDAATIQATYAAYAAALPVQAAESYAKASLLGDQEVEAEKTATGFAPIISVNFSPMEKLNIALKYEFATKLEFTNSTTKDVITGLDPDSGLPVTMFPDGAKTHLDIPAQLVVGATYQVMDPLMVSAGMHYYFDKNVDWDGREELLDGNSYELALGLEYALNDNLLVSCGYLYTTSGATGNYQNNMSYSLPSNSVGAGFAYKLNSKLELNIGCSYTMYQKGDKNFSHDLAGSGTLLPVLETYDKDALIGAIGLNFNFGKTTKVVEE
ncbi:MAG: outer membrane protein transport protein [Bacteroidales bacterium]|nr:outer membrane protein transport protein [Bacteroidales bacterium]